MTKAELLKSEKIIRAGLLEAELVVQRAADELKLLTPNQPIGSLEIQVLRGTTPVAAALFEISQRLKQMEPAA